VSTLLVNPATGGPFSQRVVTNGATCEADEESRVRTNLLAPTVDVPASYANACFSVSDYDANAATNPITIDGNGALIDGEATLVLSTDGETAVFLWDEGEWRRLIEERVIEGGGRTVYRQKPVQTAPTAPSAIVPQGTFAQRPAAGVPGRIYSPSDKPYAFLDSGTEWQILNAQRVSPPPAASAFTVVQTAANGSIADDGGTLLFSATRRIATADRILATQALPNGAGGAYTLTAAVQLHAQGNGVGFVAYSIGGLGVRTAAGAVSALIFYSNAGLLNLQKLEASSLTAGASIRWDNTAYPLLGGPGWVWLRIADDGAPLAATNVVWSYSLDGQTFYPLWTASRQDGLGGANPATAGLYLDAFNGPTALRCFSYSLTG